MAQDGIKGDYIAAMKRFSALVDDELGRHLTINATGAVAAVMLEIGGGAGNYARLLRY